MIATKIDLITTTYFIKNPQIGQDVVKFNGTNLDSGDTPSYDYKISISKFTN